MFLLFATKMGMSLVSIRCWKRVHHSVVERRHLEHHLASVFFFFATIDHTSHHVFIAHDKVLAVVIIVLQTFVTWLLKFVLSYSLFSFCLSQQKDRCHFLKEVKLTFLGTKIETR